MLNHLVTTPQELTPAQRASWLELQRSNPETDSAFFHPEYACSVGRTRDDIRVGIVERDGQPELFFPFQLEGKSGARGVGTRLCEFHGVISKPDAVWNPETTLREFSLKSWHFDHLVTSESVLKPSIWRRSESPYMDLAEGFDAYYEEKRRAGSGQIKQVLRKTRKLEREVGPLRFELHSTSDEAFDALLAWKAEQQERTGRIVLFKYDWILKTLQGLRGLESEGFSSQLCVLYCADRPVAVHFGLQCGRVLHWWFPGFDPELGKYSPGSILLVELAKLSQEAGIDRIDLGKGDERYKQSFLSGNRVLGEGMVTTSAAVRTIRRNWSNAKTWMRASPSRSKLEAPIRKLRKLREYLILR